MQFENFIRGASVVISVFGAWWICSVFLRRDDVRTFKRVRLTISVIVAVLGGIAASSVNLDDFMSPDPTLPNMDAVRQGAERLTATQPSSPPSRPAP